MEKGNPVFIKVTIKDLIESTTTELFHGSTLFGGSTISFNHKDNGYTITRLGKHYLSIETNGKMKYTLDLKPQTTYEATLEVEGFTIPIEVTTQSLDLTTNHWDVIYKIYQQQSLLYHNHLHIAFE